MKYLFFGMMAGAAVVGFDWLLCQFVVWGLSLYHVSSGMWGPYFLMSAFFAILTFVALVTRKS